MKRFPKVVSSFIFGVSVVGCGGGGGGSTTQPTSQVVVQPVVTVQSSSISSIVTAVQPNTYAALSEEAFAFDLLNAERSRCGFGTLKANTQLNAAAKAHADYQLINNLDSHFEDASLYPNGFTGADPNARVLFQGYTNADRVGDLYSRRINSSTKVGHGLRGVRNLLAAPYHLSSVVSLYRDVGISVRSNTDVASSNPAVVFQTNLAYKNAEGPQLQAGDEVITYPCEGSSGLNRQMAAETPNPVPGRNLATSPLGPSIYVQLREGNVLTITRATMTQKSSGAVILLRTPVTSTNDVHGIYKSHQGMLTADAPVAVNSEFNVLIEGTNNGVAFTPKSFMFTTGSGG